MNTASKIKVSAPVPKDVDVPVLDFMNPDEIVILANGDLVINGVLVRGARITEYSVGRPTYFSPMEFLVTLQVYGPRENVITVKPRRLVKAETLTAAVFGGKVEVVYEAGADAKRTLEKVWSSEPGISHRSCATHDRGDI
jgi:hypothetical protein